MMAREQDLEEAVSSALEEALGAGRKLECAEVEAYASCGRMQRITAEQSSITAASSLSENVLFVRVVEDGRLGIAFSSSFDARRVRQCVEDARDLAKIAEKDSQWPGFAPNPGAYPRIQGLFNKSVESLSADDQRGMLELMIDGATRTAKGIIVNIAGVEVSRKATGVANLNGLDALSKDTLVNAYCWTVRGKGKSVTPDCTNVRASRRPDIDFEKIGETSALIALHSSTLKKPRTEECSVVFSPMAVGFSDMGLLSTLMARGLSGERIFRKNSFLQEKVGERIASKKLTLVDDPLGPGLSGSRPFDDEGCPSRRTELVSDGVLKGFLWDNYFGSISGAGSTGNAIRDRSTGSVSVSPTNLQVKPGRGDMEKIISGIDHGYFVWGCQGVHTSNFETGNFSFVASPGLLIEKGELVGGVRGAMLSGNIIELLANIDIIGSEVQDFGGSLMPTMSFRDVRITTG